MRRLLIRPRRVRTWVPALLCAMLLSACGFQLRGAAELPAVMDRTKLVIQDRYSDFARELQRGLTQNGVQLVEGDYGARLEIPVNRARREILSVGGTARVREFRVRHRVEFRLVAADGQELLPLQIVEQTREVTFDETEILAAEREEEFLREELAVDMAQQVLRRLQVADTTAGG